VIDLTVDTSQISATARIIAKHLTALADELEHRGQPPEPGSPEVTPARQEINNTAASTERRWAPHQEAPATPFGFGR
jgi:hypothetical protein